MEKLKKIPALRFAGFYKPWKESKLSDLFEISAGGDIDSEYVSKTKNELFKYPIYANAEKDKGFYGYSSIYKIDENVITVAGRGVNIGIAHARNHKFYPIVRLLVLKPKNHEDIYFFEYQINRLNLFKESTGVPQLTAPQISNYFVSYPEPAEQTKIATFLSAIDEKLQALKKRKALLQQYKQGVMQKIFAQEIRFKDDTGKDFPEWDEKELGDVGKTFNGLSGKSSEDFGTGKPYIQYKQIFDDSRIDISRFDYVQIAANENQNRAKFGDAFFTTSSETPHEVGLSSVLLDEIDELYLNSFSFGFRIYSFDELSPYYAQYLFRSPAFRKEAIKLAQGSTRYNMSKVELMTVRILLPSAKEQSKIANFLSSIDDKLSHCQTQIIATEKYKIALLQQMFV